MNQKNLITTIIVVALIAAGFYFLTREDGKVSNFEECVEAGNPVMESYPRQCSSDGQTFVEEIKQEVISNDKIQVQYPTSGETVTSPFELRGLARGTWYFEATFSAELVDANGNLLTELPVMAEGDWMTEDFVPFSAMISFSTPQTNTGKLILRKANASGLPEHDDSVEIPVAF
ncbi:TPA: hypothetical protein DCG61_00840 [Patescibacteria group bacterium]|jgi:hypothetical protein|nr:hypothetical protein [Patescibacteria group bacterium]